MTPPPIRFVFLELTNRCNFSCTFCPDGVMTRRRQTMPGGLARRLIDEIASRRLASEPIQLHVMGEPFLHPELFDILAHARDRGLAVRLFTNGALLTAANRRRVLEVGLPELVIGLQTHTEALYIAHRRGRPDWATYLRQIQEMIEAKVAAGSPLRIDLQFMNTQHFNRFREEKGYAQTRLPLVDEAGKAMAIVETWKAFGREVSRRHGLAFEPIDLEGLRPPYLGDPLACVRGDHCEILPGVVLSFKEIGTFCDYLVRPIRFVERFTSDCRALNEQFAVLAGGECTLCCVDYDGKMAVGHVSEGGIEAVWNSAPVRALQRANDEGRFASEVCRVCRAFQVADDYARRFPGGESDPYDLERGFYPIENGADGPFRWTGARAVVDAGAGVTRLALEVRPGHPRLREVTWRAGDGDRVRSWRLETGRWQRVEFELRPTAPAARRIVFETDDYWIPAAEIAGSDDRRELGVMVRGIRAEVGAQPGARLRRWFRRR